VIPPKSLGGSKLFQKLVPKGDVILSPGKNLAFSKGASLNLVQDDRKDWFLDSL
jgi:hypothetical protein